MDAKDMGPDVHGQSEQAGPAHAVPEDRTTPCAPESTGRAGPADGVCKQGEQHQQDEVQCPTMQQQQQQQDGQQQQQRQHQLLQNTVQQQPAQSSPLEAVQQCRSPRSPQAHRPAVSRAGSPCGLSKLRQRAARCIEKHEKRVLLELQAVITQTAFSTAAGAAAGAAFGAGAAVTAAEQALAGRLLRTSARLLSPPETACARARDLQPAAVQQLQQHTAQLQAQLEAAEAKLHVHRTASSTAKNKISHLEYLLQQLRREHSQQGQQLASLQQEAQLQVQQISQQQQQLLQREQTMRQQQQTIQQQQQELRLKERQLKDATAKLQQGELGGWKQLAAHASLDEQELRQQQQLLQQEQAEHFVHVQQLALREQQLDEQQEQVQEQLQQQLEHLQQQLDQQQALRVTSMQLQLQEKQLQEQQQQLEQERKEVQAMMQQVEQERQGFAEHVPRLSVGQQSGAVQQAVRAVDNQQQPCVGSGVNVQGNACADLEMQHAEDLHCLPKLPVLTGLLHQVAQTLASPSSSHSAASPAAGSAAQASSAHVSSSAAHPGAVASDSPELAYVSAVDEVSTHESWSSALSTSTAALSDRSAAYVAAAAAAAAAAALDPPQKQEQRQQQQARPQHVPPLPNLDKVQAASDGWQLIPSPSSLPPGDQHQYHASAFCRVLEQVASANLDAVQGPAPGGHGSHQQVYQVQPEELARLAEYLRALVADNTVLCCEVFHLQRLLAEQHRVHSDTCQAIRHKIASEAEEILAQVQQAELLHLVEQGMCEAALRAGGSVEVVEACSAAVRDRLSPLLAEHQASLQDLLLELGEQVATCLAEVEEAEEGASAADIEEQMSAFELAYAEVHSENGAVVHHQHGTSPTACAAVSAGPGSHPDMQHKPGVAKPFVTSPSGHVSLLPSRRRASAAQQTAAVPAGGAATAAAPTAAALNKRRSRLAELFGSSTRAAAAAEAGAGEEPSEPAAEPAAGAGRREKGRVSKLVSLFSGSTRSSVEAAVENAADDGGAQQVEFTMQPHQQQLAVCLQQQPEVQNDQLQQQQQAQPGEADSPHVRRMRGATLAVLDEVVERLQGATGSSSSADKSSGSYSEHYCSATVAAGAAAVHENAAWDPSSGCEAADEPSCVITACSPAVQLLHGVDEQKQQLHANVPLKLGGVHEATAAERLLMQAVQEAAIAVVSTRQQHTAHVDS